MGSGTATTYSWDNSVIDGTPFTPGVGSITYTVTGIDGNGCFATDQTDVNVNPMPNVTLASSDGDNIICDGDAVTFTTSGASTYEFFINGGSVQGPNSLNTYNTSSLTDGVVVSAEGTSGQGCTSTAPQTFTFTVNNLPSVSFNSLSDMCENDAPHTLVEGLPSGGVYSGTGVSGGNFDPGVALTGAHTLTYNYTDLNGCSGLASQNINVLSAPTIIASGSTTICEGNSTTISASGGVSYSWDNSLGSGTSHLVSPITSTSYIVVGTAGNTCQNSDTVTVTVNSLPTVTLGALSYGSRTA